MRTRKFLGDQAQSFRQFSMSLQYRKKCIDTDLTALCRVALPSTHMLDTVDAEEVRQLSTTGLHRMNILPAGSAVPGVLFASLLFTEREASSPRSSVSR